MKKSIFVSISLLVFSISAKGALLLHDPFLVGGTPSAGQYNAAQITGQGPTVLGYTGNWINGGTPGVVSASGLSYPGLLTSGGALLQNNGGSREGRLLLSPFTASTAGTFYMSVLIDLSAASGGNYKAFELHNGGFTDATQRVLQIGQGGTATDFNGTTNFGLRLFSNDSFRLNLGPADTETNLFVLRFNLSTENNADTISIYRNPSLESEPAVPIGTLTGFNFAFDRTSVANFQNNGDSITVDEIRIGDSYSSVLPVPEPTSAAMAILGSLVLFGRRRRS